MIEKALSRLNDIISKAPELLMGIGEEAMCIKTAPEKWSKKEILGHLIDSATNNHQRFVRGQFESIPAIKYDQNRWNEFNFYQHINSAQIITFWTDYNKHLVEIIKHMPPENYSKQIRVGEDVLTLEFLIIDYVDHMEHHLKQIIDHWK